MKHVALRRLGEFVTLHDDELEPLEQAVTAHREVKRRYPISTEGEPVKEVYLLLQGWVGSSMEVDFHRRQLVKIHLPGEILGLPNISLLHSAETLIALTPTVVGVIPLDRLARLFEIAPRLAFTLFVSAQQERVMLMDQLAVVGQTNAIQRVCALLLHVYRRLKLFAPDRDTLIDWPLSQQHVAQGAGITTVHVNRTLRELARRGLIAREGKRIRLLDLDQLCELAGLPERKFVREPAWLVALKSVANATDRT